MFRWIGPMGTAPARRIRRLPISGEGESTTRFRVRAFIAVSTSFRGLSLAKAIHGRCALLSGAVLAERRKGPHEWHGNCATIVVT